MIGIYSRKAQNIVCLGPENVFLKLFYHFLQGWTISQAFMKPLPLQFAICLQRGHYFWIRGIFLCVKLLNAWFVPQMMFRSTSTCYKYVLFFVLMCICLTARNLWSFVLMCICLTARNLWLFVLMCICLTARNLWSFVLMCICLTARNVWSFVLLSVG
jgi:hypothetical protein